MTGSSCLRMFVAAIGTAAALLGFSSPASAILEIALQEAGVNGGAITVVATAPDFTSTNFTGTYGDFTVTVFGGSSDNGNALSDLLSSTVKVQNNSGATQTLHLWVTQTNYSLPPGTPLGVESGLGGSVNTGTVGLPNIFQAYADAANNALGTGGFTNGPQTATQTGSTIDTGSATGSFNRTGLYSLTSVVNFTMSGGGTANYSDHINVTAVPEPATLLLIGTGLVGLSASLRRKRAATSSTPSAV